MEHNFTKDSTEMAYVCHQCNTVIPRATMVDFMRPVRLPDGTVRVRPACADNPYVFARVNKIPCVGDTVWLRDGEWNRPTQTPVDIPRRFRESDSIER